MTSTNENLTRRNVETLMVQIRWNGGRSFEDIHTSATTPARAIAQAKKWAKANLSADAIRWADFVL